MTIIGWFVVALAMAIAIVLMLVVNKLRSGSGFNAMGYEGFGYCPNMGACDGCDVCEED